MQAPHLVSKIFLIGCIALFAADGDAFSSPPRCSLRYQSPRLALSTLRARANPSTFLNKELDEIASVIRNCAYNRSIESGRVISALEKLEQQRAGSSPGRKIDRSLVQGTFELIFSSAVAGIPLVGSILDGYMPNREVITFDFDTKKEMSLIVETLPFIPTVDIYGDNLIWDEENATLQYTIRGKEDNKPPSRWDILFADEDIVAARSSVTGLNVIRRLQ